MNQYDSSSQFQTPSQQLVESDPLGYLDPKDETASEISSQEQPFHRRRHVRHWLAFWITTWGGTTLAGSLFGGGIGMFGIADTPTAPLAGLFFGSLWSGGVGLFIFFHLGIICWIFFWLGRPLIVATIAGLLVGLVCGLVVFSLITGPMGAGGAYLLGFLFLQSKAGKEFQATIESSRTSGNLKFTTKDLLLRMTVISLMVAGWTAWIKSVSSF